MRGDFFIKKFQIRKNTRRIQNWCFLNWIMLFHGSLRVFLSFLLLLFSFLSEAQGFSYFLAICSTLFHASTTFDSAVNFTPQIWFSHIYLLFLIFVFSVYNYNKNTAKCQMNFVYTMYESHSTYILSFWTYKWFTSHWYLSSWV